ncbi:hypothetical protein [Nocardia salmonicida]|nr:hypothetical protein [Nocardia salmonicida]
MSYPSCRRGPQFGNTWQLIRENGGWQADLPALRHGGRRGESAQAG